MPIERARPKPKNWTWLTPNGKPSNDETGNISLKRNNPVSSSIPIFKTSIPSSSDHKAISLQHLYDIGEALCKTIV